MRRSGDTGEVRNDVTLTLYWGPNEGADMAHLVTAVIKPHKLEEVKDALRDAGVSGCRCPSSRATAGRAARARPSGAPSTRWTSCPR